MSQTSVSSLVQDLQKTLNERQNNYVAEAERILERIVRLNDPSSIGKLIGCFSDTEPYDELMFSIVHSIEAFDDKTYVKALVNSLPDFIQKAPRWCSIVHMRVINSTTALPAYINEIQNSEDDTKNMLRRMIVQMGARGAQIAKKTVPLLKALN